MKNRKFYSSVFLLMAGIGLFTLLWPAGDSNQNILPLGPSPGKLIIDKIEKDQILDCKTGNIITLEYILRQCQETDVFILGEIHDNYRCHTFQRDFIEALVKVHPKVIVGFEFFQREHDADLELLRTGKIGETELIERTGWYQRGSLSYGYTRLVMEVIAKYGIKVIGLNVSRTILRTVSRNGFEQLPAEEKKLFPTIHVVNNEHRFFIKSIFGTFAAQVPLWFENVYTAQTCWDSVMAESMRHILAKKEFKGYKGVIIAGSNHVAYGLGIPFRYHLASKKTKITTIMPIRIAEADKDKMGEDAHPMQRMMGKSLPQAEIFSRGIADFVFAADQPLFPYYLEPGLSLRLQDDQLEITQIKEGGWAEQYGLAVGDILLRLDGKELKTPEQFYLLWGEKKLGDLIRLEIEKNVNVIK